MVGEEGVGGDLEPCPEDQPEAAFELTGGEGLLGDRTQDEVDRHLVDRNLADRGKDVHVAGTAGRRFLGGVLTGGPMAGVVP